MMTNLPFRHLPSVEVPEQAINSYIQPNPGRRGLHDTILEGSTWRLASVRWGLHNAPFCGRQLKRQPADNRLSWVLDRYLFNVIIAKGSGNGSFLKCLPDVSFQFMRGRNHTHTYGVLRHDAVCISDHHHYIFLTTPAFCLWFRFAVDEIEFCPRIPLRCPNTRKFNYGIVYY